MFWKFEISVCKSELCGKKGDLFTLLMEMLFWGAKTAPYLAVLNPEWHVFISFSSTFAKCLSLNGISAFQSTMKVSEPNLLLFRLCRCTHFFISSSSLIYMRIQNFLRLTLQGSYCRCDELYFPCYSTL